MNSITNNLALAGKPIDDDDFITLILNGVGLAYDSMRPLSTWLRPEITLYLLMI